MSISFQSTSASSGSRNDSKVRLLQQQQQQHVTSGPNNVPGGPGHQNQHPSFLGGIFQKRERKLSKSDESGGTGPFGRSTEV